MGEYVNASIKFGGKLPAEHTFELCDLLNAERLDPDWGEWAEVDPDDLLTNDFFGNSEVNYGNLDEVRTFAEEHDLYYLYECGAGSDWDAEAVFYDPTTKTYHQFVGEQDKAITLEQVKELGSYEAVVAYFDTTMPPFEIVGNIPQERPDEPA